MSEIKKLTKKYVRDTEKLNNLKASLLQRLDEFIGLEIRLSKQCVEWYREHGEPTGVPFDKLNCILKRPKAVIKEARFDKEYGFIFTALIDGKYKTKMGEEDIS